MSRAGARLLITFLQSAYPRYDREPPRYFSWEELVAILFENGSMIREAAVDAETPWKPASVRALDAWLADIAEAGTFSGALNVPDIAAEELWRRWRYAIIACQFEAEASDTIDMPVPTNAPEDLQAWAIILYLLRGPARQYPREKFKDE